MKEEKRKFGLVSLLMFWSQMPGSQIGNNVEEDGFKGGHTVPKFSSFENVIRIGGNVLQKKKGSWDVDEEH